MFDATVAGRRHARPGIAWRASRVYAGGQLKYEGRRGAYDPPTACAASIDLDDALAMVQHGRALRLSGWEGFFVANARQETTAADARGRPARSCLFCRAFALGA